MACARPDITPPGILDWDPFKCCWLRVDGTAVTSADWPDAPQNVQYKAYGDLGISYSRYILISG